MSHSAKIQTKFLNLNALTKAFETYGWKIIQKAKARLYAYDPKRDDVYDYVAVNPQKEGQAFDLGINVKENGELDVYGDFWGGSIEASLGSNLGKLRGEYAYRVMEEKFAFEGATVFCTQNQDGTRTVDVEYPD